MSAHGMDFRSQTIAQAVVDTPPAAADTELHPLAACRGLISGAVLGALLWALLLVAVWGLLV